MKVLTRELKNKIQISQISSKMLDKETNQVNPAENEKPTNVTIY